MDLFVDYNASYSSKIKSAFWLVWTHQLPIIGFTPRGLCQKNSIDKIFSSRCKLESGAASKVENQDKKAWERD